MIAVTQKPVAVGNWRKGGGIPRAVTAVTLHVIEGSLSAADSWFNNPDAEVSAHFGVGFDGRLHQYVGIHDVAYHAGRVLLPTWVGLVEGVNPNTVTVGIEHEGNGTEPWPAPMIFASAVLSAWLCERFTLQPSPAYFPLHREIFAGKTCPGPAFNRAHYLDAVSHVRRLFGPHVKTLITGIR